MGTNCLESDFGCEASNVGADDGKGDSEVFDCDVLKTRLLDGQPGFAVGVAAVANNSPEWANPFLHAPGTAALGRGDVFNEHVFSSRAENTLDLPKNLCLIRDRAHDERRNYGIEAPARQGALRCLVADQSFARGPGPSFAGTRA